MCDHAGERAQERWAEGERHREGRGVPWSLRCTLLPAPARPSLPAGKLSGRPYSWGFHEGFTMDARGVTHPTCSPAPPSGGRRQTGSTTVPSTPCWAGAEAQRGGPLHHSRRACRSQSTRASGAQFREPGSEDKHYSKDVPSDAIITWDLWRVWGALCQQKGAQTNTCTVSIISQGCTVSPGKASLGTGSQLESFETVKLQTPQGASRGLFGLTSVQVHAR